MYEATAMHGIANQTGNIGSALSPPTTYTAIWLRKNMCMRYIPKVSLLIPVTQAGALLLIVENSKKAPKVASRTFGVQNSQLHSNIGVSIASPGTPFHQKDHPVKAAPAKRHNTPTKRLLLSFQVSWKRM